MGSYVTYLKAVFILLGGVLVMVQTTAQNAVLPKEFPIGFWCAPPEAFLTLEQFGKMKEAGFSVVLPPCEGGATVERNLKILELCQKMGLKAILSDSRIPLAIGENKELVAGIQAMVKDYRKQSALLGYIVTDEPGAKQFAGLAEVVRALRKAAPSHLALINLFPNYASNDRIASPSQLNTNTYDEYLEAYLKVVAPDVLSYDHYHFLKDSDRVGFLGNLASAQKAAEAAGVPFWNIILSVQPNGGYRALNENELRYEAMQSLAYGVKGLIYFTYWLPPDDNLYQWSHAIMARDGKEGPLYQPVKRVNTDVRMFAKYLYRARCVETFQTGSIPEDGTKLTQTNLVQVTKESDLTIGIFHDGEGYTSALITNRDYRKGTEVEVQLLAGNMVLEYLDNSTNKMVPIAIKRGEDGRVKWACPLPPAGATLVRWK